jgi:hypothetical protein
MTRTRTATEAQNKKQNANELPPYPNQALHTLPLLPCPLKLKFKLKLNAHAHGSPKERGSIYILLPLPLRLRRQWGRGRGRVCVQCVRILLHPAQHLPGIRSRFHFSCSPIQIPIQIIIIIYTCTRRTLGNARIAVTMVPRVQEVRLGVICTAAAVATVLNARSSRPFRICTRIDTLLLLLLCLSSWIL